MWVLYNGQICEYLHISGHYKEEDSEKDKGEGRHPASVRGFRTSFTVKESLEVDFRVCIAVDFQLGRSPDGQLGLCQVSGGLRLKIQGVMGFFTFYLFLRIPWTTRRSILKEISSEYTLEGLMLKLKLQYLATWCEEPIHWKRLWYSERLMVEGEEGDRGWNGCMASQIQWKWTWMNSKDNKGQGGLARCSPQDHRVIHD